MTKKIISALTAFVCAASACAFTAFSVSAEKVSTEKTEAGLKYVLVDENEDNNDDFVRITGCDAKATTLNIPTTIEDLVVKEIVPGSFKDNANLTTIEVSQKNTYFDSDDGILFTEGCKDIVCFPCAKSKTSYTIPTSVKNIEDYAFASCAKLTAVTIPDTLITIGNYAFYSCEKLDKISIPKSVESVGVKAFSGTEILAYQVRNKMGPLYYADKWLIGCENTVVNVMADENTIQAGTTGIAGGVFKNFKKLSKVEVPSSVLYISDEAFMNCPELTNISIPTSVKKIGDFAFSKDTRLTEIELPNQITKIGVGIFAGCSKLAKVNIPANVLTLPESAFEDCASLVTADIPDNIIVIEKLAYNNCTKLKDVIINNTNCTITDAPQTFSNKEKSFEGTINGYVGSTAEKYASRYNRDFQPLDGSKGNSESSLAGDANEDGKVNVRDCAFIASKLAQGKGSELPVIADFNNDKKVNVRDAAAIANYLATPHA